jgi:alcohol dehydrogenase class IV
MISRPNRSKSYQILLPQVIRFGTGILDTLGQQVENLGAKKALIVTGPRVYSSGLIQPIEEQLLAKGISLDIFSDAEPEPSLSRLDKAKEAFARRNFDVVIGVGGGSSLDTAKGLSILLAYGGSGEDYIGTDKIPGSGIPLITIPTTAGTGSEVTNIAIFSDLKKELKVGMVSNYLLAKTALIDPTLTYGCPTGVTAASGIDAFVHAIECYTSNKANDFTDAIAIKAMKLIWANLKEAVNNGSNKEARNAMAEGALLAGIAFGNSGVAAVHALAYPLGARFHVSHGVANGLLLPYVMECNISAEPIKYTHIAEILGVTIKGMEPLEAAAEGVKAIKSLVKDIGIPHRLRELNVPREALEGMAVATMDVTRLLANNPKDLSLEDVKSIWENAW